MVINVSDLLQYKVETLDFDFYVLPDELHREGFDIKLKNKARVKGSVHYDGEIVNAIGSITAVASAQCSRCLKVYDHKIDIGFDEEFSKNERDGEIYPLKNNEIDLEDMVIDLIILSMPLKMLCKQDCKGLCPKCGCNLNDESCSCDRNIIDPRFAALKDLFKDD